MMEANANQTVAPKPRPRRPWFNYFLQAFWVVAFVFVAQIYYFSIVPGYHDLMLVCSEPNCVDGQLTTEGLASLNQLGIPLQAFALYQLVLIYFIVIIYAVISTLIFRAKRNDKVALYTAIVLLLFGAFISDFVAVLDRVQPQFKIIIGITPGLTIIAFAILCYVFPDGRFVPKWTWWAMWGWIAIPIFMIIGALLHIDTYSTAVVSVLLLLLLATCVMAPIHRYRTLASRRQREQLKWVLFGLAQLLGTLLISELLSYIFPTLATVGTIPNFISNFLQLVSLVIFPITIGMALLRYRLWNVDLVINRTLVYVPLTSIVTVFYTTSIAVGQRYFTDSTGQQSLAFTIFVAIVLTTIITPIKNSLQTYVDRHFKEAQGNLNELKELDKQVSQVALAFDWKALAQRVVDTIVEAHNAKGAALYYRPEQTMLLAYRTPNWTWAEGEVAILLSEGANVYGRLLLGQRNDRDDYTWEEIEGIRKTTLPIVRNMILLAAIQNDAQAASGAESEGIESNGDIVTIGKRLPDQEDGDLMAQPSDVLVNTPIHAPDEFKPG